MTVKLMEACDWDESKTQFPVYLMPKIDGVRGANLDGTLRGRSLKTHKNKFLTNFFSTPLFEGLDGEFTTGADTGDDLCRKSSSMMSTIDYWPTQFTWWVFDYCTRETEALAYWQRYQLLLARVHAVHDAYPHLKPILRIVPVIQVSNMDELLQQEEIWLQQGYEGVIGRSPNGMYKHGRATVIEGGLWRIKRFVEEEAIVTELIEGQTNTNVATVNEKGNTRRSSCADGMVNNGLLGCMMATLVKDVPGLFKAGDVIKVNTGTMTDVELGFYWRNPDKLIGHTIKFKFFPKGVKDKPRFPNYVCHRDPVDMGVK